MADDISRDAVESLLGSFLAGTQGVVLAARIRDLAELPDWRRLRLTGVETLGRPWSAWSTE